MNKLTIIEINEENDKFLVEYNLDDGDMVWEKEIDSKELMVDLMADYKVYSNIKLVTYAVEVEEVDADEYSEKSFYVYTNSWTYNEDGIEYNDEECKPYKNQKSAEKYSIKLKDTLYKEGFLNHRYCKLTV